MEVGITMGFTDMGTYRQPNVWVKKLMMGILDTGYDKDIDKELQTKGLKIGYNI